MKQTKKQRKLQRSSDGSVAWRKVAQATVLSTIGVLGAAAAAQTGPTAQTDAPKGADNALTAENLPPARPASNSSTPDGQEIEQHPQHFDIPAGDLGPALEAYAQQVGLHVHSSVPPQKLATFHTRGVQGDLGPEHALHHLLEDTGLDGWISASGTVEIAIRSSEHVEVTGEAGQVTLQQFPQPLLDTAQTVTQVPEYILSEQADTTLRDTLRNVPGISIAAGEGGSQGDSLTIRGFNARNDIYLDGIRDFGSYYRDSFDYSAVDVLEGPASVEFGRGSTGGVVNQETKQPEERNFVIASGQFGTDAMRRGTLDANRQIKAIPGGTAARLNIVGEEAGVAGRDITNVKRFGIAPSISFGLDTKTRTTLNYLHEAENDIPDYGLPYFGNAVPNVPHNTYYGLANANFLKTTPDVLTARVDHDFGSFVTLRNSFRWANYPRVFRITEPQINSAASVVYSNTDGSNAYEGANTKILVQCAIVASAASSCFPFNTPLSQVMVKRNEINGVSTEDMLWDQLSAAMRFSVHHINNNAVVLLEGGRERSNPNRPAYTLPYTTLLNPNPYDAFAPTATTPGVTTHVASQSYGVDFLDTMEINRWLQLSGGVRFDYFSTTSNTPQNGTTAAASGERLDKQPTYRAAVVVKPRPEGSVYFDWGTSFNPSAESLSLSGNNATSPPEYNETYELGAKWEFLHERLNLNGSIFRTEKLNARETDPTNSNNIINSGNQLVRGVQIGALGHMPGSFDLILGYAYLDGEVEKSILNASPFVAINNVLIAAKDPRANTAPFFISPKGYPLANVPKNAGNFWVTHRIVYGFVGGFGGNYVAARRASSSALVGVYNAQTLLDPSTVALVPKSVAGYTSLNLMLKRSIGEHLNLQMNLINLTNAFFIDQPHPGHLVPGEGRNAQFGINYKF
ncbi:catecholate siderophore receptor [Bryocella elongata]|uniref:Catecholate siderophore receptor n=1 Tax=Bryocella elongata TaxID=863522 RepID=A0A1H5S3P9_9BACT|nr:TonB-dependent receptor [Bryocella elongata]SEF44974.1 catecholate siderophore receptor [Bryocella elongata]